MTPAECRAQPCIEVGPITGYDGKWAITPYLKIPFSILYGNEGPLKKLWESDTEAAWLGIDDGTLRLVHMVDDVAYIQRIERSYEPIPTPPLYWVDFEPSVPHTIGLKPNHGLCYGVFTKEDFLLCRMSS